MATSQPFWFYCKQLIANPAIPLFDPFVVPFGPCLLCVKTCRQEKRKRPKQFASKHQQKTQGQQHIKMATSCLSHRRHSEFQTCQKNPARFGILNLGKDCCYYKDIKCLHSDTLAEWLRRRPAKPMGSPCVGSNPTGVDFVG